jgi:colanic acid biosynthesis glycosyl transferase WcaI
MRDKLLEKGVSKERAVLFLNGVDTDSIFPLGYESPLRQELGIDPNKVVALYSGTMGNKQGLEAIVEVARLQGMEDIQFVLCGEGPIRNALVAKADGLPNVRFLPLQPVERLNDLLNLADVHLLPQKAGVENLVLPSKLGGMLASGRPILACASEGSAISSIVGDCGVVVPPDDVHALAAALRHLSLNEKVRQALGQAARKKAVRELHMSEICRSYEELLEAGSRARLGTAPTAVPARREGSLAVEDEQEQESRV